MNKSSRLMTFNLQISLKEFESKSGVIDLRKFLKSSTHIAESLKNIYSFSYYVNFAETIVNGFQIKGKINNVFNHKRFIQSLKYFQEKNQTTWSGNFTYRDRLDSFIFYAPNFKLNRVNKVNFSFKQF